MPLPIRHTIRLDSVLIAWVLLVPIVTVVIYARLLIRHKLRHVSSALAVAATVAVAWLSVFLPLQRHTSVGILACGGGRYWVRRAASTSDPAMRERYLWYVLTSSNYGVNAAESAVQALPNRTQRSELFLELARITPLENWRAVYTSDAARTGGAVASQ